MVQALNSSEVIKIKQHRATNVTACHGVVDVDDFQDRKLGKNFHLKGHLCLVGQQIAEILDSDTLQ